MLYYEEKDGLDRIERISRHIKKGGTFLHIHPS